MIKENLTIVEQNICSACERSGRKREDILCIAVSKTKPIEDLKEAYEYGCRDFGENKVQEILNKYDNMPSDVRWHMIGHLQTNKVKYIVDKVYMIHSVDSLHLAKEISKEAVKRNLVVKILLEVNVAEEDSKFGVLATQLKELLVEVCKLPGIQVCGLMTIAPYVVNAEDNRRHFVKLRELCIDLFDKNIDNNIVRQLSMGMTGDYEVAVEEGSTMLRVGTGIFGIREYSPK